jgi:enterochelin esterase-like enzyme
MMPIPSLWVAADGIMPPTTPDAREHLPRHLLGILGGNDWLSSWWTAIGVGAVCLAVGLWLLRRRRLTRLSRRRRGWDIAVVTLLALLTTAAVLNAYTGYVPNEHAVALAGQALLGRVRDIPRGGDGTVLTVTVPGAAALRVPDSTLWVYLPPGYSASGPRRYPVMYVIHGEPGTSQDWFTAGDIDHEMDVLLRGRLVQPFIVVAPDVNGGPIRDSECLNAIDGPQGESWLYQRVVPFVDAHWRAVPAPSGRVLGGMSSGGYCTLDQGLRHQHVWGLLLAFEPYGDPGTGGEVALGGNRWAFEAHSPSHYLPTLRFDHPMPTYIDVGSRGDVPPVQRLAEQLVARHQTVLFRVNAGQGHSWWEVRAGLPYALVFASRHLAEVAR